MSTMSTEIAIEEPPKSFFQRLIGVYVSPGATFADVARKPDFIAPLIVMVVLTVAGTELFLAKIGMEPILRWAFEHSSRTSNMSPDQMNQMIERMVPIQTGITHAVGFLWVPFLALVIAGVGLGAVNSIFGAQISFKTAYSVACYAYLVNIVYYLLAIVMTFLGDPEHFINNPQSPTPTNVGFFLNPLESSKPMLAVAGSVEIFTFWYLALLGIGFSEATARKVKFTPLFLIFLGLWIVGVLIKAGLATLG